MTTQHRHQGANPTAFTMTSDNPKIPTQHKAVVYDKPGDVSTKIVTVDTPEPGPGEVLINLYDVPH